MSLNLNNPFYLIKIKYKVIESMQIWSSINFYLKKYVRELYKLYYVVFFNNLIF